jgi:hypothetical protein
MSETRTIDEALTKFTLISGAGNGVNEACVMTLISWQAGEGWSDHPPCSHRLLADMAIRANDAAGVTVMDRERIVRAGQTGLLDTWWVPTEVVVYCLAQVPEGTGPVDGAVLVCDLVTWWKATKGRAVLSDADLSHADLRGADLRGADLRGADLRGADLRDAVGDQWTRLPAGWKVADSGLIVREV